MAQGQHPNIAFSAIKLNKEIFQIFERFSNGVTVTNNSEIVVCLAGSDALYNLNPKLQPLICSFELFQIAMSI